MPPQTFVTWQNKLLLFSDWKVCRLECEIRSDSIFGKPRAAQKFGRRIKFCSLKFFASDQPLLAVTNTH